MLGELCDIMYVEAHINFVCYTNNGNFVFDRSFFNGESQNFVKRENCPVNSFISALCFSSIFARKQVLNGASVELISFLGRHMYSSCLCCMEVPDSKCLFDLVII